jgi:hypothetical protein
VLIIVVDRYYRQAYTSSAVSKKSRVALGTLRRMEGFDGAVSARTETLNRVVMTLERAGVEFLDGGSPGVRLKPQAKH